MPQSASPPPADPERREGFFDDLSARISGRSGGSEASHGGLDLPALAKTALPFLAMAARRAPIGLAVIGAAAAGLALANPATRAKIVAAGRRGLDAVRR